MNDVGKPCAGEPHARFEVAGAGNGVARSAIRGSQAGVLRNATATAWSGPSRPISRYRASARPYSDCGSTKLAPTVLRAVFPIEFSLARQTRSML